VSNRIQDSGNGHLALLADPPAAPSNGGSNGHGDAAERADRVTPPPPKRTRRRIVMIMLPALLLAGIAVAAFYWIAAQHFETTDDAFIDGRVIAISPQVPARVEAVKVDDNQFVHKGDVLVLLDKTDYAVALDQANGALAASRGKLEQAKAQIPAAQAARQAAQAALDLAQANFANADQDLKRYESLDARARSRQIYDNAIAAQKTAQAQVGQATANLASAAAQIATAKAAVAAAAGDVEKAQADVKRAQVNLDYCTITAPEDGRVTRKNVEPGAYVTSAAPLLAVVPAEVWVVANFKETQLDLIRPGQAVTIGVDSYSHMELTGKVESIQSGTGSRFSILPAENATGNFVKVVQRVPVKITLDNAQNNDPLRLLAPGMSVEAKIKVR